MVTMTLSFGLSPLLALIVLIVDQRVYTIINQCIIYFCNIISTSVMLTFDMFLTKVFQVICEISVPLFLFVLRKRYDFFTKSN